MIVGRRRRASSSRARGAGACTVVRDDRPVAGRLFEVDTDGVAARAVAIDAGRARRASSSARPSRSPPSRWAPRAGCSTMALEYAK